MGARAIDPDRDVDAARSARDSTEHATRGSLPVPGSEGAPPGLPPRYLACLRILEALPENRSGADKTWVEEALRSFRDHYRQARRVR